MSLNSRLVVMFAASMSKTQGLSPSAAPSIDDANAYHVVTLASGTGAGKADGLYHTSGTLGGGGLSLNTASGGGLVDPFGDAVAMLYHRALYIRNTHASTSITVGGTSGIVGSGFTLRPKAAVLLTCDDVTEASGYTIGTVTLSGSGATYELGILGASA